MDEFTFADNSASHRFELRRGDEAAVIAQYRLSGDVITFTHTEVLPEFQSVKGLGSKIAQQALDNVRARGLKVVPQCEFIARYIGKHPEYEDMLTAQGREKVEGEHR